MNKVILGIDPGKNGGLTVMTDDGVLMTKKMPDTDGDIATELEMILRYAENESRELCCYMEKVGGMPGQGGSAMFSFGRNVGFLYGVLASLKIPVVEVTPQKWQKMYSLGGVSITKSSSAEKREHKNRLKGKAQQLFPGLGKAVTLATADSILIAEYGRRLEK